MLELKIRNRKISTRARVCGEKNEEIRVPGKKKKISVRGEKKHKKSVRGGENSFVRFGTA